MRTPVDQAPPLPAPRGPLSEWLCRVLTRDPDDVASPGHRLHRAVATIPDTTTDDDAQLTLHCIYELSYRGFAGVDDAWEWAPPLLDLRRALEARFERDLRAAVDRSGLTAGATTVAEVLGRASGPSLSGHMAREGTRAEFVEFCLHRSAYQLKEADPHSWGLLRLSGPRKAALVEIQADEYGNGRVGEAHADLFTDVLTALDLDASYGAHLDAIPAVTLATDNLVTLLGSHRRLRSALLGHLAGFEMTSVDPDVGLRPGRPPARARPGGRALLRRARGGRRAPRRAGVEPPRGWRPRGRRPLDPRDPLRRRRHVGARGPRSPAISSARGRMGARR